MSTKSSKMQELLEAARAAKQAKQKPPAEQLARNSAASNKAISAIREMLASRELIAAPATIPVPAKHMQLSTALAETRAKLNAAATGMHGEAITYNAKQQEAIDLAASGKSFVLLGAAGTGKTTCTQGAIQALLNSDRIPVLQTDGHRYLTEGTPGILIVAYTRRAVNNSRKAQSEEFRNNCLTVHKLLEYKPEKTYIIDPITGEERTSMRFLPSRTRSNPLPNTIRTIIVEEASMLSSDLFAEIADAIPEGIKIQWIFVGDIQQLPPVFGSAILGYKLLELPAVELTEVYRQALESPIIRLAHRVLSGKPVPASEFHEWSTPNKLTIHPWKKKLNIDNATATLAAFFRAAIDKGLYDPEEDTILLPHGKLGTVGTVEVNKYIANHLARTRNAVTHEVISGFNKFYLSEGDRVLYDKEDAEILTISSNLAYSGKRPQVASKTLDYWGHNPNRVQESVSSFNADMDEDIDKMLANISAESADKVNSSSHVITLRLLDTEREVSIDKSAEVNTLLHAYALTVHKSQGSEWRKVFVCLHQSHSAMVFRELLYTAVTRAREELYIICEPDSLEYGITKQRIKGNTLAEKAEFFKGKAEREI